MHSASQNSHPPAPPKPALAIAEFAGPSELLDAARSIRAAGYKRFDCHSPFPIHGMDAAMAEKRSPLGFMVGIAALVGCVSAITLQGWTSAIDYRIVISGKPFFSGPAFVPVTFEVTVLFSAFAAVLGMLALNGLPRLYHPLFFSQKFARVTDDAFYVAIEADDIKFDEYRTAQFLQSIGGKNVEVIKEPVE